MKKLLSIAAILAFFLSASPVMAEDCSVVNSDPDTCTTEEDKGNDKTIVKQ
ncbi:MAG: hypothetical protein Q9M28_02045 [Mariprofundaceae bacterium]|nr:hypothetical protein [Mariprofundaceae bacterium]